MKEYSIPRDVARHLGYYVYLYVDPRTNKPFYIGKGKGERVLAHLSDSGESIKVATIKELHSLGLEPHLEVLAHGLKDEETALRIEAAVIDLFGIGNLTNAVRGWKSIQYGRMSLKQLIGYYAAKPINIDDPLLLIRINKKYRHNITPPELYEITRGVWKVGPRRERADYACSVFQGVIKEIYKINSWHKAGTTEYETRAHTPEDVDIPGRWEFIGEIARPGIHEKYIDRDVSAYFKKGAMSPIMYVNC